MRKVGRRRLGQGFAGQRGVAPAELQEGPAGVQFGVEFGGPAPPVGLPLVDAFLNSVNPAGLIRRPTFWAPGRRYARPVG